MFVIFLQQLELLSEFTSVYVRLYDYDASSRYRKFARTRASTNLCLMGTSRKYYMICFSSRSYNWFQHGQQSSYVKQSELQLRTLLSCLSDVHMNKWSTCMQMWYVCCVPLLVEDDKQVLLECWTWSARDRVAKSWSMAIPWGECDTLIGIVRSCTVFFGGPLFSSLASCTGRRQVILNTQCTSGLRLRLVFHRSVLANQRLLLRWLSRIT